MVYFFSSSENIYGLQKNRKFVWKNAEYQKHDFNILSIHYCYNSKKSITFLCWRSVCYKYHSWTKKVTHWQRMNWNSSKLLENRMKASQLTFVCSLYEIRKDLYPNGQMMRHNADSSKQRNIKYWVYLAANLFILLAN